MIVLGKNKIDERYNILEDGTIVDLNGNVQELGLHRGRLIFKGVAVHQIQIWTNYGWRDGKEWDIHHLDENPLNNHLSNLVFLSHSEHSKLHHSGNKNYFYGKHHTDESKKKMSKSHKENPLTDEQRKQLSLRMTGKNNPMYGKSALKGVHPSIETIEKISNALKGKLFSKEHKLKLSIAAKNRKKGRIWVNNGSISKMVFKDNIPEGFIKGRLF